MKGDRQFLLFDESEMSLGIRPAMVIVDCSISAVPSDLGWSRRRSLMKNDHFHPAHGGVTSPTSSGPVWDSSMFGRDSRRAATGAPRGFDHSMSVSVHNVTLTGYNFTSVLRKIPLQSICLTGNYTDITWKFHANSQPVGSALIERSISD